MHICIYVHFTTKQVHPVAFLSSVVKSIGPFPHSLFDLTFGVFNNVVVAERVWQLCVHVSTCHYQRPRFIFYCWEAHISNRCTLTAHRRVFATPR